MNTETVLKDKCQLCEGNSGGEPGNENIIEGVIVCDYCSVILIRWNKFKAAGWTSTKDNLPTMSGEYIIQFVTGTISAAHWNASTQV
jgi:hypothetical protein